MKNYKNHYLDINKHFGKIMEESLNEKNIMMHARLSNFIDDYLKWTDFLKDRYEVSIYKEALSEYKAMLLFGVMGMYKYAFMALRGYLELTLFGIKLSTNELDYKLWKSEKLDVSWAQIVDEDKGLFSKKYVEAFQEGFWYDASAMKQLAKVTYRECSEHIHSNYDAITLLAGNIGYNQEVYEKLINGADSVNRVIMYSFVVRYLENILKLDKLTDFEDCIVDNIGYLGCVQEIYK